MFNSKHNLPFVSVIIPVRHDWERLNLCIDGIQNQSYPQDNLEVVIVNNDPQDPPPEEIKLAENFTLLTESQPGSYAARNRGLETARGEIVAFTDADCIPDPEWLMKAVKELSDDVTRVAGKVELFYTADTPNLAELYEKVTAFQQERDAKIYGTCTTANLVAARKTFEKVGNFDSALQSGGDIEWGLRAQNAGFRIGYSPEAIVLHPARNSLREILKKERRVIGGRRQIPEEVICQTRKGSFFVRQLEPFTSALHSDDLSTGQKLKACLVILTVKTCKLYLRCRTKL